MFTISLHSANAAFVLRRWHTWRQVNVVFQSKDSSRLKATFIHPTYTVLLLPTCSLSLSSVFHFIQTEYWNTGK